MSLVFNLTSERVSERMWQTLPLIYDLFNKDNADYFTGKETVVPDVLTLMRERYYYVYLYMLW